jgi:ubiquinone biosynthesis UbiH/UbiF/VisC/COQ6 family hydroxylase
VRAQAALHADTLLYGEMGVVANFECERPHRNTAFQWFRADGVLAWLPLPGKRISVVWSTPDVHAQELLRLDAAALCARVAEAGAHRLGALALLTPPAAFPLRLTRVPRIVAPRLALVGDAAHAIHPLSGHGINLGFLDARALADLLRTLPEFADCGDERQLRRYARTRAEEIALLQWTTHGLQRLFRPQHPALALVRNLGLNLTDSLPVVRNRLVRYALG